MGDERLCLKMSRVCFFLRVKDSQIANALAAVTDSVLEEGDIRDYD